MKKLLISLAAAMTLGTAFAQTKWDLPSGYGANTFQVQNLTQFAADVDKATAGKLKITVHPNASLFKANEIKRAVQSGQTQSGEFILSLFSNEAPIFGLDSIPFLASSYADAKRLTENEKALFAYCNCVWHSITKSPGNLLPYKGRYRFGL